MDKAGMIVVTGGGGFIGAHMVRSFQEQGFDRIRAVDVKPLDEWYQITDGVENLRLDLRDKAACFEAAAGAQYIFNLAADMGGIGFIEGNKALCMLSSLISTHVLMAAHECDVERVFYSSSACVYAADKQTSADITALREVRCLPRDARGRLRLGEVVRGTHGPALLRGLRARDARHAVPQRLRAVRHVRRWTREGAGCDLPQGRQREAQRRPSHRHLGRRRADAQLHVHRRLPPGLADDHGQRHRRAAEPRKRRARHREPARRHRRRHRGRDARAVVPARRATGCARPEQRQHAHQGAVGLGAEHPAARRPRAHVPLDPRRAHGRRSG